MIECILLILKTYQTLIVGFLGFSGVVLTMLFNAKMQREQHASNLKHEANLLRVAIKTELLANQEAYEIRIKEFNKPNSDYPDALMKNSLVDNIYNELIGKIGVLTEVEVEKVIHAYAIMSEVLYRVRIIAGTDKIIGYNNESIRITEEKFETVSKLHANILPSIVQAISSIDNQLHAA